MLYTSHDVWKPPELSDSTFSALQRALPPIHTPGNVSAGGVPMLHTKATVPDSLLESSFAKD
jgi:hypothetical protein